MRYKKNVVLMLFLTVVGTAGLWAQKAVVASGGDASGDGGSTSYSVGQVFYSQLSGNDGSVAQGVQQPYEIMVVTGIEKANAVSLDLSVYPNPATDFVTLKLNNFDISNLSYCLYDNNGKLIENKIITEDQTTIAMSGYHSSIYFLKVIQNEQEIKVFKIIKH